MLLLLLLLYQARQFPNTETAKIGPLAAGPAFTAVLPAAPGLQMHEAQGRYAEDQLQHGQPAAAAALTASGLPILRSLAIS